MSLRDVPLRPEYRSLLHDVVSDFYTPTLSEATLYQRAVGFFSSSALTYLSAGILGLVRNWRLNFPLTMMVTATVKKNI